MLVAEVQELLNLKHVAGARVRAHVGEDLRLARDALVLDRLQCADNRIGGILVACICSKSDKTRT